MFLNNYRLLPLVSLDSAHCTPHSPVVRDGADAEEEHRGADELVHEAPEPAQVRRRVCGEYPGCVRD